MSHKHQQSEELRAASAPLAGAARSLTSKLCQAFPASAVFLTPLLIFILNLLGITLWEGHSLLAEAVLPPCAHHQGTLSCSQINASSLHPPTSPMSSASVEFISHKHKSQTMSHRPMHTDIYTSQCTLTMFCFCWTQQLLLNTTASRWWSDCRFVPAIALQSLHHSPFPAPSSSPAIADPLSTDGTGHLFVIRMLNLQCPQQLSYRQLCNGSQRLASKWPKCSLPWL